MENIQLLFIGFVVADFLLNTGRGIKAIELFKECLIFLSINEVEEQYAKELSIAIFTMMIMAYLDIPDYTNATKYCKKLLVLYRELGREDKEGEFTLNLGKLYERQYKYAEAKELFERAINIAIKNSDRNGEANACGNFANVSYILGEYIKAKEYMEKELIIRMEMGDRKGEARVNGNLGTVFKRLGEYVKAQKYHEKKLTITMEIGDKKGEAACYGSLGAVLIFLGEYAKAREYLEKGIVIQMEIGDRYGEGQSYESLGTVFQSLGEYTKAQEYHEKALEINLEIGDRERQAPSYTNLGVVFQSLGEYAKAKECHEKALAINTETGNRAGEAVDYGNLGNLFQSLGEYAKAEKYYENALAITVENGDRYEEAACYGGLGNVFQSLGKFDKAEEFLKKDLAIRMKIGDRNGEATDYGNLGIVFQSLGKYARAEEFIEKAIAIQMEIGDRNGEASSYGNLGTVFLSLGEYSKAQVYYKKALAIKIEIGDREGQAAAYGNLGTVLQSVGEYAKAQEYLEKALVIRMEIGDRKGQAADYGNLGTVCRSLAKFAKAKEYIERALAIRMEIGYKAGEAADYLNLGTVLFDLGEYVQAKQYFETALSICKDIGDHEKEVKCYYNFFYAELSQGNVQKAINHLHQGIQRVEEMRVFLEDNDEFKISFSDVHCFSYQELRDFFCASGKPTDALCVEELRRARALADLMATQYSLENKQISAFPHLWIQSIMKMERNCTGLYITYHGKDVLVWILKVSGAIDFRRITVNEDIVGAGSFPSLDDFFGKRFRSFGVLSEESCEDRSFNDTELKLKLSEEESVSALRLLEEDEEESQTYETSLSLCYRMIIGPVADLLEEPEIIVAADRFLNQVPFAALRDEDGKYLSEAFRIRIIPSLSTLKLIQDCPADYHRETGALIVGDPKVGQVFYKGRLTSFTPLECARNEAEMVGRLVGVQPLLGECATKRAVLERIHSVSLIHIAAHGNAERGEIALAPTVRTATRVPLDDDYLLTMSDISQVQLRAKLVVLSCCHSGRGQIRAEGVVGIARAFLGAGARSVLVGLWALRDSATEELMNRFYEHLALGESASESLHEAMKWMRGNGFPDVADWAPFMLIGDNVTFDFGKGK